jgi:hypothetical protein
MLLKQLRSFTYGCGPYSVTSVWVNSKGKASFVCNQQQVSISARQQQQQVMQRPDKRSLAIQVTQAACCTNANDI